MNEDLSAAPPEHSARGRVGLLAVCVVFLGMGILSLDDSMFYSPDSAHYVAWAKSLAFFEGFRLTLGPEPSHYVPNAPLYPALLAPLARLFPYNVIAAKGGTLCFGLLVLVLFFRLTAKHAGSTLALWTTFLLMINPLLLLYSTQVLSDVPFAACLLLALLLADRLTTEQGGQRLLFAGFVGSVCAAVFLREIGFSLLLAAVIFLLLRREYRRAALVLIVPLLLYLVWFIRNELIVAGAEQPAWRNTRLFLIHALTGNEASTLDELTARIRANAGLYGSFLGGLVWAPQFVSWMYDVVRESDPAFLGAKALVGYFRIPLTLMTLVPALYGMVRGLKDANIGRLVPLFLLLYSAILAVYPISDVRFLFPVLVLILYSGAIGAHHVFSDLRNKSRAGLRVAAIGTGLGFVLLAIPNLVWTYNFIGTSRTYSRSSDESNPSISAGELPPAEFTKFFDAAGEWIADHTDSSAVVGSRYIDAALWAHGRKVLPLYPFIPLEDFESLLRDYRISYLLAVTEGGAVRDFELQMILTKRFAFRSVHRAGDIDIIRVEVRDDAVDGKYLPVGARPALPQPEDPGGNADRAALRGEFIHGLQLLGQGHPQDAERIFQRLQSDRGVELSALYYRCLALEFSQRLEEAEDLLGEFARVPQAGIYLPQIDAHRRIIRTIRAATAEPAAPERAYLYHLAFLEYWQAGFRGQALEMLHHALQADSTYFTGLVSGAVSALKEGRVEEMRSYVRNAESLKPQEVLVHSLKAMVSYLDSLRIADRPGDRSEYHLAMCNELLSLGLNDLAVDHALRALNIHPDNPRALRILADVYTSKRRYAPAVGALEQLCARYPEDTEARQALARLQKRW